MQPTSTEIVSDSGFAPPDTDPVIATGLRWDTTEPTERGHIRVQHLRVKGSSGRILPMRLKWRSHSPTGFEWGYEGSGPAQLALAILAEATGDREYTLTHYQAFKRAYVAGLPRNGWTLHQSQFDSIMEAITGSQPPRRKRGNRSVEASSC